MRRTEFLLFFLFSCRGETVAQGQLESQWPPKGLEQPQQSGNIRSGAELCSQGEGIYSLSECHSFLKCGAGGQYSKQRCPANTLFNSKLSVCDHPRNVPDCEGGVRRFHAVAQGPRNVILYKDPLKVRSQGRCQEGQTQPHPYDCDKYEICADGSFVLQSCPPGENFDGNAGTCQPSPNVDCGMRSGNRRDFACHPRFSYIRPHPDSCEKFIECENGKLLVKDCDPGGAYNPKIRGCDYENGLSICRNNAPSRQHQFNSRSGSQTNLVCSSMDFAAAHREFCNQFVECESGRLFTKTCGPGTVYNRYTGVCDWKENTRELVPGACGVYLECQNGKYREIPCSNNGFHRNGNQKVQTCPTKFACRTGQGSTSTAYTTKWTTSRSTEPVTTTTVLVTTTTTTRKPTTTRTTTVVTETPTETTPTAPSTTITAPTAETVDYLEYSY